MSFDMKNKENTDKYCSECLSKRGDEHVCSSQLLSDSVYTLSEVANEQLNQLKHFSLSDVHLKSQEILENWHKSAVQHLEQIYNQRLNDLNQMFNETIQPDLNNYRLKLIQQVKNRIIPKINQIIDQSSDRDNPTKAEQIKGLLSEIETEYVILRDHEWLSVHLPDLKNFSVPIRIAKMALAAKLSDGEKDPLDDLSDEETKKKENLLKEKKKKENSVDIMDIFATNPEPFKTHLLETNSSTLAFSTKHILIHDSKKLILFDLNKKIYEFQWNDNELGILVDICWMSSLSLFIILSIHSLYLYDPMKSSPNIPMKVETIKALDRSHVFASLAAFDRDLYINYHKGVHIDQYCVVGTSEWILQKRYSKNELCEPKDIGIRDVRANKEHVCFSIMQHDDLKWRLDLMSRDMIRVRRGVAMDAGENQHKFFSMLIPIQNQCWLFVNWFTNKLWIVDQQGKTRLIKESKIKNIRNIALSQDSAYLAIRLEKPASLNIYKLFL